MRLGKTFVTLMYPIHSYTYILNLGYMWLKYKPQNYNSGEAK